MTQSRIVIFMGSKKDLRFASRIKEMLQTEFNIECEYVVASAHKTTKKLLEEIQRYEKLNSKIVFISIAGLSDALSGVLAGNTKYPVIACPPDSDTLGWPKIFSSVITPKGVSVSFVPRPENAALYALKILSLSNPILQKKVENYMVHLRNSVFQDLEKKMT